MNSFFPILYPKPKKIFYEGVDLHFSTEKLNIRTNFGKEFLKGSFIFTENDSHYNLKIDVVISSSEKDLINFEESNDFRLYVDKLGNEGYLLKVHKDDKKISIFAESERGAFYAFNSFMKLYDEYYKILPVVEIYDNPSFKMRGIIEGFYGKPWSHNNRLDIIEFCGENNMNTYWYAPKDDPYHRERWREDYPQNEMKKIEELIKISKNNFVDFTFCVSPGLSMKFSDENEFQLLAKKYYEILSKGVKNFAILFDDIPEKLVFNEDEKKFSGNYGLAQIYVANKLYDFLKSKDSEVKLFFCPTEYWQKEDSLYRRTIREELNKDICIIWTGDGVWSETVSRKNADEISNQFGHELILWDNYPVNDADKEKLFMAPLTNRENDLYKSKVTGVISNPMNQAYASMIALETISDYLWNSENYNPISSWNYSIFKLVGKEFFEDMKIFCENMLESRIFHNTSLKLKRLICNYQRDENNTTKIDELGEYLRRLKDLEIKLSKMKNQRLFEDIKPWVHKLSKVSELALTLLLSSKETKNEIKQKSINELNLLKDYSVCNDILDEFIMQI